MPSSRSILFLTTITHHETRNPLPARRYSPDPTTLACAVPLYRTASYVFQQHRTRRQPVRPARTRQHLHPPDEPHQRRARKTRRRAGRRRRRPCPRLRHRRRFSTPSSTSPKPATTSSPPATSTAAPTPSSRTSCRPSASRSASSIPTTRKTSPPPSTARPAPCSARRSPIPRSKSPTSRRSPTSPTPTACR